MPDIILGALYMLSPVIFPATCEVGNTPCVTDKVFGAERSWETFLGTDP